METERLAGLTEKACEQANSADMQTKNMIDFIFKYDPIYIQRQITHTLQNVLEDPKLIWRLNWFNDIKMPLLTTLLMYKSDVSIEANMSKFEKIITLGSLTSEEMFIKNATKSN